MKRSLILTLGGLTAALVALGSYAQQTAAPSGSAAQMDIANSCGKARDPQRCNELQKAKETCKDKSAAEKRKCMMDSMPPMDCSKARSPQRCEAMQKAKEACKEKSGAEHRQCIKDNTPKRGAAPKG